MRVSLLAEKFKDISYLLDEIVGIDVNLVPILNEARLRVANLRSELINELVVRESSYFPPRMTNAQRDRLWEMCANYHVDFSERHYIIDASSGMVEGWVGGHKHASPEFGGTEKPTIYVGVTKEGESHT